MLADVQIMPSYGMYCASESVSEWSLSMKYYIRTSADTEIEKKIPKMNIFSIIRSQK